MIARSVIRQLSYGRSAYASINKSAKQSTVVNEEANATSLNLLTGDQMAVRLSAQKCHIARRQFDLPKEAVDGLRETIKKSKQNPKWLQCYADKLSNKILGRHFPLSPEVVNDASSKIMQHLESILMDNDDTLDENMNEQSRQERERQIEKAVEKELSRMNSNWKENVASDDDARIYALARLAPNYAEVARVLEELQGVDEGKWTPKSVLDFGAGAGGAFWALNERYGKSMQEYTAIERNEHSRRIAIDIMRRRGSTSLVHDGVLFREDLVPSLKTTYDLVIVHRTLIDLATEKERFQLAEALWRRTNRFLILIESDLQDSFYGLMDVRNFLLTMGMMMDKEKTEEMLKNHGKWNDLTARLLNEKRISEYERFEIFREQLPPSILPPTMLPPATVVAPCPHDLACPRQLLSATCSFRVGWSPVREGAKKKEKPDDDGTSLMLDKATQEKSSFSFTILEKRLRGTETEPFPRILKLTHWTRTSIDCFTCSAKGLQRVFVPKGARKLYNLLDKRKRGDIFPFHTQVLRKESGMDASEMKEEEENEEEEEEDEDGEKRE